MGPAERNILLFMFSVSKAPALFGTDWFGAKLLDAYGVPFNWLVLANSVTTAVTVPLVLLLPAAVVALRDSEGVGIGDGAMVGLADAKERSPL